jgi:hypothetical protein
MLEVAIVPKQDVVKDIVSAITLVLVALAFVNVLVVKMTKLLLKKINLKNIMRKCLERGLRKVF